MDLVTVPALFSDITLRLVLALVLGAAVGLDRELQRKPAGLRTHALVSLGAALLTVTGLLLGAPTANSDAVARVLQGIVAGIGFIGGGVILHRDETNDVYGLTTAATIWMVAALGVAIGAGLWRTAAVATLLTLVVLVLERPIDWFVGAGGRRR
jgi:putative Mg2+ transporter-C (MgtC) family protein